MDDPADVIPVMVAVTMPPSQPHFKCVLVDKNKSLLAVFKELELDSMTIWRLFCNRQDKIWMKSTTFSQIKKIQSTNFGQKKGAIYKGFLAKSTVYR
jgi:hypothetical protein